MSERGMKPKLPRTGQAVLKAVEAFSSPLVPADYLELVNPLWSTRELRGRIVEVKFETDDAATIVIKPGFKWVGHTPGQYLRIGIDIDGVRHWRAYSLSSDAGRADGCITITVKKVDEGMVSPFLVRRAVAGTIVTLSDVEGTFTLPDPIPEKILFVTAGSGITPVMAMLRHLDRSGAMPDVVHVHSAPTERDAIFRRELQRLHERHDGVQLHLKVTKEGGRFAPDHLDELCPDWREREAYVCGPESMLDAMTEHYAHAELEDQLHFESFTAKVGGGPTGDGGTITFLKSDTTAECGGGTPILEAGESAGLELPYGCRMGICHTCVGTLKGGQVRDMRTGEVHGESGETIRTCIHAPEGAIEIEL